MIKSLPWKPSGKILDPYAGGKKWWKGVIADVTFTDKFAPGVIRANITTLPFKSGVFDEVWADPPHFIRKSKFAQSCQLGHFGAYPTRAAVHAEWAGAAAELHRVTKSGARLVWKIIDKAKTHTQCVCKADAMVLSSHWTLIDEYRRPSRVPWSTAETVFLLWRRKCEEFTKTEPSC